MDPKMDSGMELQITPTFTVKEAREGGLLPSDNTLNMLQVILVMDRLFQAEIAFYKGHNLLQTIFSCLYIHDLRELTNPFLQVYFYATLKCCNLIRETVAQTDICEEEDFNGIQFGFHLSDKLERDTLFKMLSLTEDILLSKINECSSMFFIRLIDIYVFICIYSYINHFRRRWK